MDRGNAEKKTRMEGIENGWILIGKWGIVSND